jgi:hypothetical protein
LYTSALATSSGAKVEKLKLRPASSVAGCQLADEIGWPSSVVEMRRESTPRIDTFSPSA